MQAANLPRYVTDTLTTAYGIEVLGATRLTGGYLHRTFRIETDRGALFLKLHDGATWPKERVQATLAIQQHLHAEGHPVPAVHPTQSGELAATALSPSSEEEFTLALTDFSSGRSILAGDLTPYSLHQAGRTLGLMHHTLRALPARSANQPTNERVEEKAHALRSIAQRATHAAPELRQLALEAADFRLQAIATSPITDEVYEVSVWQVVHGDYYPPNLLFRPDGTVAAVVDFDFAGPRWRGIEIARAIVEVAVDSSGLFDPVRATHFMRGYLGAHALDPVERRSMFRLWFDNLLDGPYPLDQLDQPESRLPQDFERLAHRRHGILLWLYRHIQQLTDWAAGLST